MIAAAPADAIGRGSKGVIFGSRHQLNPASVRSRTSQAVHKTGENISRRYPRNVSSSRKRCQR
jgi:hypothetical protein